MILYLIFAGNRFGLTGVIISMVIAWGAQFFIQIPSLIKKGYRYRIKLNFHDEGLWDAAKLALPVLISSWIQPLCVVINMAFSSSMGDGAVSGLNWANKIYIIMVGVFAYAVTNFIFPRLSRLSSGSHDTEFSETTRLSLGWIIFIISYISAMFITLAEPIIKIIFEYGEFTANDTKITATALFFYSFGMTGYAICEILNKSFYAIRDGKTPMLISVLGILTNLISAFIFIKVFRMDIGGLALASASSSVFMALCLLYMINKRKSRTITKGFIINIIKTAIAALLSGFFASIIYTQLSFIDGNNIMVLLRSGITAALALLIYLGLGFVLKIDELKQIRRFVHEK